MKGKVDLERISLPTQVIVHRLEVSAAALGGILVGVLLTHKRR